MERIKKVEQDEKYYVREQQKIYKDILDNQVKTKVYDGLKNPYYQNNTTHHLNQHNYNSFALNKSDSPLKQDEIAESLNNLNPNLFYNSIILNKNFL
jgi:hypothetical protein